MRVGTASVAPPTARPRSLLDLRSGFQTVGDDAGGVLDSLRPGPVESLHRFEDVGSRILVDTEVTVEVEPLGTAFGEPAAGFVSAPSPLGAGLLGLRAGDTARWRTPDGQEASAEIVEVLFQPEASGDYLM